MDEKYVEIEEEYVRLDKLRQSDYENACELMDSAKDARDYKNAADKFRTFEDYKDCKSRTSECDKKYNRLMDEQRRKEEFAAREEQSRQTKKRNITIIAIVAGVIVCVVLFSMINKKSNYDNAVELYNNGEYEEAISSFEKLNGYKESDSYLEKSVLGYATELMNNGSYTEAIEFLQDTSIAKEDNTIINDCKELLYNEACNLMKEENYGDAIDIFTYLEPYRDSTSLLNECNKEYEWNNNIRNIKSSSDWSYFDENIDSYKKLNNSEITRIMVGKWDVYYESNSHVGESEFTSNGEYYTLSNGERIDILGDGGDDPWGVENDRLWVVSSGYSHAIYEMRDGYYLAVDSKGEADHIYKKQ